MIVTITTFNLPEPTTVAEITKTFEATAPKYMGLAGLVSKNYFLTEDGKRAGGIYIWESRADADRLYTDEWRKFVEGKYGTPAQVEYLHSPVMVDNRDGSIRSRLRTTRKKRPRASSSVTRPWSIFRIIEAAPPQAWH